MELLKELCQAPGIPGRERPIIDIMTRELKKSCHSVQVDNLGNVIGIKKSEKKGAKTVMLSGHMDEIGFVVSFIEKSGHIRFCPRGGHVPRVLLSQRVKIYGKKILTGIVEGSPAFLNRDDFHKAPEFKNMHIDVGMSEKELKKILDIGDAIVMEGAWIEQGNMLISKAFDNRIGCYLVLETMKQLHKKKLNVNVLAVGSSQEEVGVRGASVAARNFSPDMGIALDVTAAFDIPGVSDSQHVSKLGEGVAIKINDQASISNHGMVNFFKAIAKKNKIKFQMEILPFGGTDAHAMQIMGGGAVCTLSVPTRYVHSPSEMLHKKDVKAAVDLLVRFLEQAEKCTLEF